MISHNQRTWQTASVTTNRSKKIIFVNKSSFKLWHFKAGHGSTRGTTRDSLLYLAGSLLYNKSCMFSQGKPRRHLVLVRVQGQILKLPALFTTTRTTDMFFGNWGREGAEYRPVNNRGKQQPKVLFYFLLVITPAIIVLGNTFPMHQFIS